MHVYVRMYICNAYMYVCSIYVCVYICMYVCLYACLCMYLCMHGRTDVRTYMRNVCLYVYMDAIYACMYIYVYVTPFRDGSASIYISFRDLTKLATIRTDRTSGLQNAVNCSGADSKPKSCIKVDNR